MYRLSWCLSGDGKIYPSLDPAEGTQVLESKEIRFEETVDTKEKERERAHDKWLEGMQQAIDKQRRRESLRLINGGKDE